MDSYRGRRWWGRVTSFNTRTGAVSPASGDYAFSQLTGTAASNQLPTSGALSFFAPSLPNVKFINVNAQPTSTSIQTVYTCPSGRRAIILSQSLSWLYANRNSSTAGTLEVFFTVSSWQNSDAGPQLPWFVSASTAHGNFNSFPAASAGKGVHILEAGDTLCVQSTVQPYSVWGTAIEFDNTANVKSINSGDLSAGGNILVYTSPASGRGSMIFNNPSLSATNPSQGDSFLAVNVDGQGDSPSMYIMLVPNGDSAGTAFQIGSSQSVTDSAGFAYFNSPSPLFLAPGDAVYVNCNAADGVGLYVTFNVVEI